MRSPEAREQATRELAELVGQANAHAHALLAALDEERAALAAGSVADIDASGQRKADLLTVLDRLDADRIALADAAGLAPRDYDAAFARARLVNLAQPGWAALLDALRSCHEANAVNGHITAQRRRHVERALHILRGTGNEHPSTYGPDGQDSVSPATALARA